MRDLNTVIKSDTKVLFNEVAPGGKSELARAGTCAAERSQNCATKPIPTRRCGTRWQFRLARARGCTTGAR